MTQTPEGRFKFKSVLLEENPLQVVGVANAYCALLAQNAGFHALYLSGAQVANAMGLPDLGMTSFSEVTEELRKISDRVSLPILVDADTGWGSILTIQRVVQGFIRAGAGAIQLEDQTFPKRCGHRPGKTLVSKQAMGDRLKAALDARFDPDFLIVARTDALHSENQSSALERALHYQEIGADILFLESAVSLEQYKLFVQNLSIPVLANVTEFGKTPLFSRDELASVGIQLILYPLSAFRAMNQAASMVYQTIRAQGSQAQIISAMQTRDELYQLLNYHHYESLL